MGKRVAVILACFALTAAAAGGADLRNSPGARTPYAGPRESTEQELKWDNGTLGYVLAQFVAGTWIGNDFDCSTLAADNIKLMRIRSSGEWPNGRWDGFNVGVFDFRSGVPGARIWGPKFVEGTGRGYPWCDFGVDWTLPKGIRKFVAAMGQRYNYPVLPGHRGAAAPGMDLLPRHLATFQIRIQLDAPRRDAGRHRRGADEPRAG